MALRIREMTEADLPAAHRILCAAGLNPDVSEDEYCRVRTWSSFVSARRAGPAVPAGHVAEADGVVVGVITYSLRDMLFDGAIQMAAALCDMAVAPGQRGATGVALCRKAQDVFGDLGIRVVGFHMNQDGGNLWRLLGATDVPGSNVTQSIVVSPSVIASRRPFLQGVLKVVPRTVADRLLAPVLRASGSRIAPWTAPVAVPPRVDAALATHGEKLEPLLTRFRSLYDLGSLRTVSFLRWRYADHPITEYRAFSQERGGALTAFGILAVRRQIASIFELFWEPSDSPRDAVLGATAAARALGCGWLVSKYGSRDLDRVFGEIGFVRDDKAYLQFVLNTPVKSSDRVLFTLGDAKEYM